MIDAPIRKIVAARVRNLTKWDLAPILRRANVAQRPARRASCRFASAFQSTLAAIAAIEFRLREQHTDFGFTAGGKQSQPVNRTRQWALLDELGAALTEPAEQLHARIVVGAHEAEATAWCTY